MKPRKTGTVTHMGATYKYRVYDTRAFGQDAIRVVCPWVGLNDIFDPTDETMVIREMIPSHIELKMEASKNATLQIRLNANDKERISRLARQKKMSVSDFLLGLVPA